VRGAVGLERGDDAPMVLLQKRPGFLEFHVDFSWSEKG
jgi:hypothetical protein